MKHLHLDDRQLFHAVKRILRGYALSYRLPLKQVRPMPKNKIADRYGDCSQAGRVRIALRGFDGKKWAKKREQPWVIVQTMAHELAHLRHFNHRTPWMLLHSRILTSMLCGGALDRIRRLCKITVV